MVYPSVNPLLRLGAGVGVGLAFTTLAWPACSAPSQSTPDGNLPADSLFAALNPQKNGVFKIDGVGFMVQHKSDTWAVARQRDLAVETGYPQVTPASQTVKGLFKTDAGTYEFIQEIKATATDRVSYKASLVGNPATGNPATGNPTKGTRVLCLSIGLPGDDYKGQKVFFDQTACTIPWWYKGQNLVSSGANGAQRVKTVRVPLKQGGTLVIEGDGNEGDLEASFQDNRGFGSSDFDLQIAFSPHSGSLQQAKLGITITRIPASSSASNPLSVAFNPEAKKPPREKPLPAKPQKQEIDPALAAAALARVRPLAPLRPRGEDFVTPAGQPVRFWGMNIVAFYPDHALAEKTADNLASLGINMVRLHHNLRPSTDWSTSDTAALLTYEADSRTPNLKAWERYDYFNARLREKGIYLSASLHGSRLYRPDDVSILKVSPEDDEAWADAMDDLNHWGWQKATDLRKMLPVFDERCFLLNAEFAKNFLTHVNPYTGIAYGKDAQVASVELINEFSTEYTLLCGNVFPNYWTKKLNALLKDYAVAHGIAPFELYGAKTREQQKCFSAFCNGLDEAYARRMQKLIRDAGYRGPIEFSNLWRGDANLRMRAKFEGLTEDHAYLDPLVVQNPDRFLYSSTKSAVVDKPVIIGEFNQSENLKLIEARKSVLSMLPLAAAAYSSLQNYSGIIWFAWNHGTFKLGADGWGKEGPRPEDALGTLAGNGTILDHIRSAGLVFKNKYLNPSSEPQIIYVDDSYAPANYNDLINGQTALQPGWQAVHGFRKASGPIPAGQQSAPWMQQSPPAPTVSDTGQIVRDPQRRQLSFSAPKAEGFSGYLDGKPISNLVVLDVSSKAGFATVIVVTLDDTPLPKSKRLLLSKTHTDANGNAEGKDAAPMPVTLKGLAPGHWSMKVTRPVSLASAAVTLEVTPDGTLTLPATAWNECELEAH